MIRLATFFIVLAIMAVLFSKTWKVRGKAASAPLQISKAPAKPKAKRSGPSDDVWMQVYDTETIEEARKIQRKFFDADIPCLVYQQGKKDVYGEKLKHYGISVPKNVAENAQNLLAKIIL